MARGSVMSLAARQLSSCSHLPDSTKMATTKYKRFIFITDHSFPMPPKDSDYEINPAFLEACINISNQPTTSTPTSTSILRRHSGCDSPPSMSTCLRIFTARPARRPATTEQTPPGLSVRTVLIHPRATPRVQRLPYHDRLARTPPEHVDVPRLRTGQV